MSTEIQDFDFSNLENLDPAEKVVRFYFPVRGYGYLEVKHTGRSNKPYMRAVARFNMGSGARKMAKQGNIETDAILEHKLKGDRVLLPAHAVTGWGEIENAAGKLVPYSTEACKEFFMRLPAWLVDRVDTYCANPKNFIEEGDDETVVDNEGLTETTKN